MILSMPGQAWLFLSTVLMGAIIGLFYDFFRIARRVASHSTLVVQLEDVLFWVITTGAVFYFMLNRNFGEIRPFSIIGVACGIMLYFATISRVVLKISVVVINFVKRVITAAVRIITLPLRLLINFFAPPVKSFFIKRRKNVRNLARYGKMRMKKHTRNWFILRKKV